MSLPVNTCETCEMSFEPNSQMSGRFCSAACFYARGPDGPRKASVKGQRMRTARGHPIAPPSGVVAVARLVLYDKIGDGPHQCHWCGRSINWSLGIASDGLVADHLDWDYKNDVPENIVASCTSCNTRRAAPGRQGAIQPHEPSIRISGGYRTRLVEVICECCGEPFLGIPSKRRKFCSKGGQGKCAKARAA
jgi:hypothetical protein